MTLRPVSARWFEVLCARTQSVGVLIDLAQAGAVEVELHPGTPQDFPLAELSSGLGSYAEVAPRYARYWSRKPARRSALAASPAVVLGEGLGRIEAWRAEADPLIDRIQAGEDQRNQLLHLRTILEDMRLSPLDFDLVVSAGPVLESFCGFIPMQTELALPEDCLFRAVPWEDEYCILVVVPQSGVEGAKERIKAVKGRVIERPPWLTGSAGDALARVEGHLAALERFLADGYRRLDALFDQHRLGAALADLDSLVWFERRVGALGRAGERFVWISGWTEDVRGHRLAETVERSGSAALLRVTAAPRGLRPPQVLINPPWMRPFEVFARALGVPGADEPDPTPLLTVVVPVLFGYMFGDLGQGLLLAAAGLWLRRRFSAANLLVACGISAALFGLLFGSLFGLEGLIPALWVHPLEDPLTVLAVPLVFAAGLLSLGQLLRGLGALWSGRGRDWTATDAGFLLLYLGALGMLLDQGFLVVLLAGALWYLAGTYWLHRSLVGVLTAVAHLAERGLQILVNTLSFARVGAFALAHAALSSAWVALARVTDSWAAALLVLVAGNLVVIVLEGLVVSIQTTRLVLFEFFVRFLEGRGRVFRPLEVPPELVGEPDRFGRGGA